MDSSWKKPVLLIFLYLFPLSVFAGEGLMQQDATARYETLQGEMDQIKKEVGTYQIRLFEAKGSKVRQGLSPRARKARSQYISLKKEINFWGNAAGLKRDLVENYLRFYPDMQTDKKREMEAEANQISLALIKGIDDLKKSYKIRSFPIIHNLFIDLGLSKRGSCKHWAEDLLGVVNRIERRYFTSYWGEAHPGNLLEHNVAVLVPQGISFREGILIDPWRMAGKPYWNLIKKEKAPWQAWSGYEPR